MRAAITLMLSVAVLMLTGPSFAGDGAAVGDRAPAFTLSDTADNEVSLSDYSGKVVVLEWLNPDCPFVQRHYKAGTMKNLATKYGAQGVVWLTINSTKYMDAAANAKFRAANDLPYPILVDQAGQVGHAIDDDPRGNKGGQATNYVSVALDEVLAGNPVTTAETKPYGCSVKYKK